LTKKQEERTSMASQEENPFGALITSWPALMAMALTIVGFVVASPKLESPRPTSAGSVPIPRYRVDEVLARLWQDPLARIFQGTMEGGKVKDEMKEPKEINGLILPANLTVDLGTFANGMPTDDRSKPILVLLALVDEDQNPEQIEIRRRERFATLSALNTAGYLPVQSDRLFFVDLVYHMTVKTFLSTHNNSKANLTAQQNIGPQTDPAAELLNRLRIPFEWVRADDRQLAQYRGVCVVWISSDIDPSNSVHSLKIMMEAIKAFLCHRDPDLANKVASIEFAITGRITSTRLTDILAQDKKLNATSAGTPHRLGDVTLYVTNATAKKVRTAFPDMTNSGLALDYVIGSDDLLMCSLVTELKNRGVKIGERPIAIISEWDTTYGQAMHKEFTDAIRDAVGDGPTNVHPFSYLRGIDGKLPVKMETTPNDPKTDGKDNGSTGPFGEKPTAAQGEGDAQVDYLRRLVGRMQAQNEKFQAIGVLGSDVYDKLLLLTALRSSFPEAQFFTTDMDARLLQPGDFQLTRNLIIASHFGLELNDDYQKTIPPFRSSYDTASYIGCLLAVDYEPLQCKLEFKHLGNHVKMIVPKGQKEFPVHLFEVGRSGPFELTILDKDKDPLGARNAQRKLWIVQSWHAWGVLACAALLGLLLVPVSRKWQRILGMAGGAILFWQPKRHGPTLRVSRWQGTVVFAGVMLGLALAGVALYAHGTENEEPFSIVEGISVWPTIAFRLLALVMCVFYIVQALEDLAIRNQRIREEFDFPGIATGDANSHVAASRGPGNILRACWEMWIWSPRDDKIVDAWKQLLEFGQPLQRLCRCMIQFNGIMVLFALLWFLFDHAMLQSRGDISRWVTTVSFVAVGAAFVFLLVFVVDSTVLCNRFVSYLGRHPGVWQKQTLKKCADERGLDIQIDGAGDDSVCKGLEEWLMIRLVALTTDVVARLIYYPFIVLLVLILAQSRLFDGWTWNSPLVLIGLMSAGTALYCAVVLQRSAKAVRTAALQALDRFLMRLADGGENHSRTALRRLRTEINGIQSGAFATFTQNPIIHALLIPLCGGGGLAALQMFMPHL
jgi:hypothetical protein